jgi:hypothetical protein
MSIKCRDRLAAEYTNGAPSGSGTSYLTTDHLGSTRIVKDAAGHCWSLTLNGMKLNSISCPGWSFNSLSDWRIVKLDSLVAGCQDERAGEALGSLIGSEIVAVEPQSGPPYF